MNKGCLIYVRDDAEFPETHEKEKIPCPFVLAGYMLAELAVWQLSYVLSALWENWMLIIMLWKNSDNE